MNIPTRISMKKLLMEWNEEQPLEEYVKIILNQYGLVADRPINSENLQEWLKNFKRYIPSPDIWENIAPALWKNKTHDLWKNQDVNIDHSLHFKRSILNESKKHLSYHKPLFENTHKMNKRWDMNLLINSYTNSFKINTLHQISSNLRHQNNQYNQSFLWNVIKKNSNQKYKTLHTDHSLGLHNKVNVNLITSRPLINSMHLSSVYTKRWDVIKKKPLIFKDNDSLNLANYSLANLNKRLVFKPILQYRWKSEQDRLKVLNTIDIIKKAKSDFKNTVPKKILSQNTNAILYKTLRNQSEESSFKERILDWSTFTCQSIKKRQSKLLDDEILMHNVITSFLEFKKKYLYLKDLNLVSMNIHNLDIFNKNFTSHTFLMPEDLFLNQTLREYRILFSLNFNCASLKKKINLLMPEQPSKTLRKEPQSLNQYEIVKRYLWPSYKLEDLACFNRFLINTANQSRFSILRIKMYPDFLI
jgi:hypothetical protein